MKRTLRYPRVPKSILASTMLTAFLLSLGCEQAPTPVAAPDVTQPANAPANEFGQSNRPAQTRGNSDSGWAAPNGGQQFEQPGTQAASAPWQPPTRLPKPAPKDQKPPAKATAAQIAEANQLFQSVEELTNQARQLESNFQFAESERVWAEAEKQLREKLGNRSWQTANVSLSKKLAGITKGFDDAKLEKLKQSNQLSKLIEKATSERDFETALLHTKNAMRITNELYGDQSPLAGKAQLQLARIHMLMNNSKEAISCLDLSLITLAKTFSQSHPDLCECYDRLGQVYLNQGTTVLALDNHKAATRMAADIWGEASSEYAQRANDLGVAYYRSGDLDTAYKIIKAAQILRTKNLGGTNPAVGHSSYNLGIVLMEKKNIPDATNFFVHAKKIFDQATASELPFKVKTDKNLAACYMLSSKPELAEPILQSLVQTIARVPNAKTTAVADAQYQYAIALCRQGKYDLAEPILVQALTTQKSELGMAAAPTQLTAQAYGLLLKQTRQTEKAQRLAREVRVAQEQTTTQFK